MDLHLRFLNWLGMLWEKMFVMLLRNSSKVCISKIIKNRIKEGLADIVSINQSAFVPGRRISDNILLTQELMHNFHRKIGPPRCAFKVDIQKAYDTVEWSFLEKTLLGFRFHPKIVKWIIACVSSTSFSLAINGSLYGYFKGRRGLRQGDPMSLYLFTLVMEVLSLILQNQVSLSSEFRFHNKCEKQRIINLCFADDLFLFARRHPRSARVVMGALNQFQNMSGLVPSMAKSMVYFGNVTEGVKDRIKSIMNIEEGELPVRYLGVPLISTRLHHKDCKRLIECLDARITDWKNKCLSFVGRLQLIKSVLSSMHVFWASVFVLPKRIIHEIEERMRRFLWNQGNNIKGKVKVKWKSVCLPKSEGGLGIRRVGDMNNALMVNHIWSLLSLRESLWVRWIHSYRIRNRSFWDIPVGSNIACSLRKMLGLRPLIRDHVWINVGSGTKTFAWFDKWDAVCPIARILTPRIIANAGFNMNTKLAEVYADGAWLWPNTWMDRFPALAQIQIGELDQMRQDKIEWQTNSGHRLEFNTAIVWNDIRFYQNEVPWANLVWFPQAIPRHSFLTWLFVQRKLKTQDFMSRWISSGNANYNLMCCSLCSSCPDSHGHLFFECGYATTVWNGAKGKADMADLDNDWNTIFQHLLTIAYSKTARNIIAKILVSASTYFIWEERNRRLFSSRKRNACQLVEVILSTVRLKLHTMRFKTTPSTIQVLQEWALPRGLLVPDDDCG
ncbi:uncharacterized protein LOC110944890 [Helianthus annuus]|uniref:uncharacterized protein LOC110944890 n=1 Tax=Helianthus annuus TaxID=4232 RepID=UPI001652FE05|nr:uncharacterized protein LOC110944890 [Helianthus annuus]